MNSIRARLPILLLELVVWGVASSLAQSSVTISLTVDATQAPEKIVRTSMVMPVKSGPLTLYYPKWIPGEHTPSGPVGNVAGLTFSANGKTLPWRRDLLDVFTFHVNVPSGVERLEVAFDYIEPSSGMFSGGGSATDKLVIVSWNQNVLYPAWSRAENIIIKPTLRLPSGWKFGTPLPVENAAGDEVTFKPVSLDRLVDSPVIAGEYYRAVDVTPPGEPIHHEIDLVADSAAALEMSPEVQKAFTSMVAESGKVFGARHYRDYHFLLTLSDHVAHFGLEHNECDDSRTGERSLLTPEGRRGVAGLLGHEFVHSWNGKFRRPADLAVPYYEVPMKTDLLWVYEGLTSYLGPLLAARSGMWTPEQYREDLATTTADMGPGRPGRTWRPLQDTADAVAGESPGRAGWGDWRRGVDYYPEGDLIWLEVATIIHDKTQGKKSFEDFCRAFYGGPNRGPEVKPYTFDELVEALKAVAPYDWAGYFHDRLTSTSAQAPVGGIEAGGWKVDFSDRPPAARGGGGGGRFGGGANAVYSLGLRMGMDGTVQESLVGGPAFLAGITPGMRVVAINDRAFTADLLHDALKAGTKDDQPIRFLVVNDDYYKTISVNYHGGERYPRLVRVEGKPDLLDDIAKPLAGKN
ncbi:MAG: M61 family peptidase [Terriglobia bacterium]|jgi:predicted metalloprotease with PDZ domain